MIAVSYHDRVNVLQGMIASGEFAPPSPFARPEWFALLEAGGKKPLIAVAQAGDSREGENFAALPLVHSAGGLEPLINWYRFIWSPLMNCGANSEALLAALAQDLRHRTHRITLWPLPDENGTATRLEQAFRASGWRVSREPCDHNHVLPVNGRSFAEYWAARPGKMRTTLKRKANKVEVEILTRFEESAWNSYEEIYRNSWKPAEGDPALLRQFAQDEGAAGRIRLGIARHDGVAVAAQFWTVENGQAYIHKLAHLEAHKPLSAGTTLSAALFEYVIDRDRVNLVDFGTGNDAYKRDWMEEDRPRFRLDCVDASQFRAWPLLAKQALGRVAQALPRS